MSELQQPMQHTPAVVPTSEHNAAVTSATDASADPIRSQETSELSPESRPELGKSGITDGTTAAAPTAPNVTNVPKEEKVGNGEVMVESHPINEGVLNYKGPGLKGLIFTKKYFWFSDAPLEPKHLSAYLGNEKSKDIAHPNAAHAQQTGKGLLFFAKRAEDKDHPQGIFNLGNITDVVKGNFNDFGFSLHGHKHNFQAVTKAEKDAWIVTLETKAAEAKTSHEDIIGSSGYKSALESYSTPVAAATTGTSRSLSRPGKKASKSRERKVGTKTDNIDPAVADTNTTTPTGITTESTPETIADHPTGTATGHHAGEVAAGGAAAGAAAGAGSSHYGSPSDEDEKTKKSRSQSRNKRGSLFGNLLAKKEDHDAKKEIKKEEKEEKKEEKAEEKDIKKAIKKEDKLEQKEEKAELKAEKKELKDEAKGEKMLEKAGDPLSTGQTPGFNAHAVAARVVGEPTVPAGGNSTAVDDISRDATAAEAGAAAPITAETTPTSATRETAPKPHKRASIFGGLFGKKEAASPGTTEAAPAVPAKDEPSAISSTAPQLDSPVTQPTTEPVAGTAANGTSAAPTESTRPGAATTGTTEKRRSSFFNTLGTKKERRTGTTSGDELTDGEGKKQPSGGFGGLLRKASRVHKGSSSAPKDAADVPLPKETPAAATTLDSAAEEKPALSEGEVGSNAINGAHEQTPVSAAA